MRSAAVPGVRVALLGEASGASVDGVADELNLHGVPGRGLAVVEVAAPTIDALTRIGQFG